MNKIQKYRENPALNQSTLTRLYRGVGTLRNGGDNNEKLGLKLGNAIDCKLTTPEDFDKEYFVCDIDFSKGVPLLVTKDIFELYQGEGSLSDYQDDILDLGKERNLGNGKWKDDTIINKIITSGSPIWNLLKQAKGKVLISSKESATIKYCSNKLKDHSYTKWFIEQPGIYQDDIYFDLNFNDSSIKCKALLDKYIINHTSDGFIIDGVNMPVKSILPIDIKTIGKSVKLFYQSFQKYRYDVQSLWYSWALKNRYPDYTILPMLFLVVSTTTNEPPLKYQISTQDLYIAEFGMRRARKVLIGESLEVTHFIETPGIYKLLELWQNQQLVEDNVDYEIWKNNGYLNKSLWL